jgi:carbon dioxide concentrating mechanism protein CcmN
MHLPPLQSPFSANCHVSGEVAIAPDVLIAPGVVIRADPNSSIVVGSGVCLGLGVVLHAHGGRIIIGAGASLGAGVLVVGNCQIGAQACIGASSTLHNVLISPSQLVPPGSLLSQVATGNGAGHADPAVEPSPWDTSPPEASPSGSARSESGRSESGRSESPRSPTPITDPNSKPDSTEPPEPFLQPKAPPKRPTKVYGKEQFERMRTLFMPDSTL